MTPDATIPPSRLPWIRAALAAAATCGLAGAMQLALITAPSALHDAAEGVLVGMYVLAPAGLWPGYAIAGRPRRGLVAVAGGFAAAVGLSVLIGGVAALTTPPGGQASSSFAVGIVLAYPLGTLVATLCATCDVAVVALARRGRAA